MKSVSDSGRIITFYSYKGGTGRSMALANIAWILASNNKRVLVIDWDLEAPGLQRYFRPFLVDKELTSSEGIVDLITEFILEAISPLEEGETPPKGWYLPLAKIAPYVISLDWKFPTGGKIDFIPAGRQGPDYALRFSAINWQKFYDVLGGGAFLEEVKKQMRPLYDYILIDSRTGVSDTSGICTVQMPDTLVVCFTFNNQSIVGASSVTQDVSEQRSKMNREPSAESSSGNELYESPFTLQIVPAPMRVDYGERDKLELRQRFARWKFDSFIGRIAPGERNAFWRAVEIPYQTWFSYEEVLAPFRDDPDDPKSCLAAFVRLTAHITGNAVNEFPSLIDPMRKQEIVQEFARTSMPIPEEGQLLSTEPLIERLKRLAEATYRSLDDEQRVEAERLWMRLVRIGRRREGVDNTKVRVPVTDLRKEARLVVERFVESGLLLFGKEDETHQETIEVSNDVLLRSWPRLLDWIENDRQLLLWRQELNASKARWEDRHRDQVELLRGRALTEALEWRQNHREQLNDREIAFIEASLLVDKTRRRRRGSIIAAAVVVIAAVFVPLGLFYSSKATNKRDYADSIAAAAQGAIESFNGGQSGDQLQLGILLAMEAERLSPSPQQEAILRNNLPQLPRNILTSIQRNNVLGVSIEPNGSRFLAVTGRALSLQTNSEDSQAQLQETSTGEMVRIAPFFKGSRSFALSPDGKYLATALEDGKSYSVGLWNMTENRQVASINHQGVVNKIAFSPNSRYIATASADGTVQVLDILSPAEMSKPPAVLRHNDRVSAITFSADSRFIATADDDFFVHVRQTANLQVPIQDKKLDSTAFIISLSPEGEYLAAVSLDDKVVKVWRVKPWGETPPLYHDFSVNAVTFFPDSKVIITAGKAGNIRVWRNLGGTPEVLRFDGEVLRLIVSPDGKYVAAIGTSNVARLWSYDDGRFAQVAYLIQSGNFNDLAFNSGNRVVTAGADNTIRVWELGVSLSQDLQNEPCSRLTRNLSLREWDRYLASYIGPYHRTCLDIPYP